MGQLDATDWAQTSGRETSGRKNNIDQSNENTVYLFINKLCLILGKQKYLWSCIYELQRIYFANNPISKR